MEQTTAPQQNQRPSFLSVICILSFIGSGLWALFSLIGIFASGWIMGMLGKFMGRAMSHASQAMDTMAMGNDSLMNAMHAHMEEGTKAAGMLGSIGTGVLIVVFVISLILAALSFFGVLNMWKLKKSGFWMYTIANGLVLVLYLISFNIVGIIITGGFIGMYAANLKALK